MSQVIRKLLALLLLGALAACGGTADEDADGCCSGGTCTDGCCTPADQTPETAPAAEVFQIGRRP